MEGHTTVLLHEAVDGLNLSKGDVVVDATLGLGGHSELLVERVGESGIVLGIDADQHAIDMAQDRLKQFSTRMRYALGNFRDITTHAHHVGITKANGVLFDLGWNSTQLASGRGFSFKTNEPLLMTFNAAPTEDTVTAYTIVNEWSESDLRELIQTLGEERFATRIAQAIVTKRKESPIVHANELSDIISDAVPLFYRRGKIHPATKTFQALRMMVNDELSSITTALPEAFELLDTGGRIAVITFHSLEDGLVKRIFKTLVREKNATIITKKPLTPRIEEIKENPRARSAKLRIIEKT